MKKIVVGVPSVNKSLHSDFVKSLIDSINSSFDSDIQFFVDFNSDSSILDMNMNMIANRVASSNTVDGVIFLSSQLTWETKTLSLLINHDKDVVSGVFPEAVTLEESYNIKLLPDQDIWGENLKAECVTIQACYVSKNALNKIIPHVNSSLDNKFHFFFTPSIENGLYNPSYATFCQALLKAGIDINVEKKANFGNIGEVKFDGNYEKLIQKDWINEQTFLQDKERGLLE